MFWSLLTGWNILIDPYGVFDLYQVRGFNDAKSEDARLTSALKLLNSSPKVLLLGSSRVEFFGDEVERLDPTTLLYSLPYLRAWEIGPLVNAFSEQSQLSHLYWGIDFYGFNASLSRVAFGCCRLGHHFWTDLVLHNTLSWQTASEGLRVVNRSRGTHTESARSFASIPLSERFRITLSNLMGPLFYGSYHFDGDALAAIEQSLRRLKKNGVAVTLFIGPLHASLAVSLFATGNWEQFENFKRAMTAMSERLEVPLWDFSTFNSISEEPIGPEMRWYFDPMHYSRKAAALMVDQFLGVELENSDFGHLLRSEILDEYLMQQRQDRDAYLKKNPDIVQLVQAAAADAQVALSKDWLK